MPIESADGAGNNRSIIRRSLLAVMAKYGVVCMSNLEEVERLLGTLLTGPRNKAR